MDCETWTDVVFFSSIPIGIVWAGLLSLFWLSPIIQQPNASWDRTGVLLFALCSLVELAAEPLWVLAQLHRFVAIKVCGDYAHM